MATSSSSSFLVGHSSTTTSLNLRRIDLRLNNGNFFFPRPPPLLIPYGKRHGPFTRFCVSTMAKKKTEEIQQLKKNPSNEKPLEEDEEEVEEDLPWIQEKALDLVEFTGSVTQALPGPRVGASKLPWLLALPLGYLGLTFVIAFVKTVRKFNSPKEKRRKLVTFLTMCYFFGLLVSIVFQIQLLCSINPRA